MMGGMTTDERTDLITSLAKQRGFLRHTVKGLDDKQAARTTTVSSLCLGGLIKHVALVERTWQRFMVEGPAAFSHFGGEGSYEDGFRMLPGETLADLLDEYDQVAADTEKVIRELPSLDDDHPLPEAPWFEPGARWSARRTVLHILAETAQHSGHADIIRESLDGAKTMG
jgi:hypothetical protein